MIGSLILASGGFWDPIAKPLAAVLAYFYDLVPNYGIAIVLLTIAMMIVLTPLTIKQTRSMLVMQKLQPEMKKLQDLHKNDRQALNEAVMALYKEHNASPLGGCLPMLLPFPLFIALLKVLEGLSHTVKKGAVTIAVPKYLTAHTHMAQDIVKAHGDLDAFGMNLAKSARNVGGGFGHTLPYFVLLLVMTGTQFYQQYQLTSKNPAAKNQPGQAMMKYIPLVFGVISINFPAGVVVYWTVSNMIRIGQQWALYRYDPKVKALVTKDVKEIEAKTREIDARDNRPTGLAGMRDRLANAAGSNRNSQAGKDAAKPTGRAPGDKGGMAGRGGRTPPGKATTGTPNAAKARPGSAAAKGTGPLKPGAPKPGPSKAGAGPAKAGTPKAGPSKAGTGPAKPGSAGARAGTGATKGGTGTAKPKPAAPGTTGAPTAGRPKPGAAPKPGISRPAAPKPAAAKSGSPTPAAKPVSASDSTGAAPPAADPGQPANGRTGVAAVASSPVKAGTNGAGKAPANGDTENPEGTDTVSIDNDNGDNGAPTAAPNGTGSPTKGRTGGGSARNVTSRNRRKGR